jgi:hypothetical protein
MYFSFNLCLGLVYVWQVRDFTSFVIPRTCRVISILLLFLFNCM